MTGFRLDLGPIKKRVATLANTQASEFRDDVRTFTRNALGTASALTPTRDYSQIRQAQLKQYDKRVNCIPDSHTLHDPSLRVKGREHWLWSDGKWWNATDWKMPAQQWTQYQSLVAEHYRRKQYVQSSFIRDRAQARYLYKRSWWEAGETIGLNVRTSAEARASRTRRKPAKAPHKASTQERGGGRVFSIVISNPFIKQPSRYKEFDGQSIINQSMARHRNEFNGAVKRRLNRIVAQ
jgi:hypothetical protein